MKVANAALIIGLLTFQSMLAVVVVSTPDALGIPQIVINWLAILNVGVGVLLNRLDTIGGDG